MQLYSVRTLRIQSVVRLVVMCIASNFIHIQLFASDSAQPDQRIDIVPGTVPISMPLPVLEKSLLSIARPFPGDDWLFFSGKRISSVDHTWKMSTELIDSEPYLICTGEPHGFLKTAEVFSEFELSLEWRYPRDPNGNSGILVFAQEEERLWPSSIQVQLYQPELGRTYPMGGAKTENELKLVPNLAKPLNHWNKCQLVSRGGVLTVTINDQLIGHVSKCDPQQGAIALQSEGSEIHFRRIKLKPLSPEKPKTSKEQTVVRDFSKADHHFLIPNGSIEFKLPLTRTF